MAKKTYKYKMGEVLYPAMCPREYQKTNPFTVKYRRQKESEFTDEDGLTHTFVGNWYSEEGCGWLGESSLTRTLEREG